MAISDEEEVTSTYATRVGERLRRVRKQKRLSLQAVEASSEQEFKASVLGAYERGERAISVPRLHRLAKFYAVPVDQLLPREDLDGQGTVLDLPDAASRTPASVTIDLARLRDVHDPSSSMLVRYLQ